MGNRSKRSPWKWDGPSEQPSQPTGVADPNRDPGKPRQQMGQPAVLQIDGEIKRLLFQPPDKPEPSPNRAILARGIHHEDFIDIGTARRHLIERTTHDQADGGGGKLATDRPEAWGAQHKISEGAEFPDDDSRLGEAILIDRQGLIRHALKTKTLFNPPPGLVDQTVTQRFILDHPADRPGQVRGIARPHEEPRGSVLDDLDARDLLSLVDGICHRRGVPRDELCGRSRAHSVSRARHEVWWLLRNDPERFYSLLEIARLFGRDHATVLAGIAAHERRRLGAGPLT